jgi:hypothetical protein
LQDQQSKRDEMNVSDGFTVKIILSLLKRSKVPYGSESYRDDNDPPIKSRCCKTSENMSLLMVSTSLSNLKRRRGKGRS